jgi:hypothetical protein
MRHAITIGCTIARKPEGGATARIYPHGMTPEFNDAPVIEDQGFDSKGYTGLGPVAWRIERRGDARVYCSRFETTREKFLRLERADQSFGGLIPEDAIDLVVTIETLCSGDNPFPIGACAEGALDIAIDRQARDAAKARRAPRQASPAERRH